MGRDIGGRFESRGKTYFRIDLRGRPRKAFPIACHREKDKEERIRVMRSVVERLRATGVGDDLIASMLKHVGSAVTADDLDGALMVVKDICTGKRTALSSATTYDTIFELWTSGALHRDFPDHVRPMKEKTAKDYQSFYRTHVQPVVGHLPVGGIKIDHGLAVLRGIDAELSSALHRNVGIVLVRPMRLAVFPLRLIATSPFPPGFMPRKRKRRAMASLLPSEDAQFLGCRPIPLPERILVGVLDREGLRVDELTSANVKDFDRDSGIFHLDENKTDDPRSWAVTPGTAEALRRYLDHFHPNPKPNAPLLVQGSYIRTAGQRLISRARADRLRANAELAGLIRPQLWENSKARRHLTVHDLRATFITVSLANGMTEAWITDRTGHQDSATLYQYKRQARTYAELSLGPLLPLHEAIPELAEVRSKTSRVPTQAPPEAAPVSSPPLFALPPNIYEENMNPKMMAPAPGLEPGTRRLTAACSTN